MAITQSLLHRFARKPKTGSDIRAAYDTPPKPREPLVSELLYNRKLTYIIADPGTGKSTVAVQIALNIAAGIPVFGLLEVARPVTTYYVSMETDFDEFMETCELARKHIDFNPDLLIFDEDLIGFDATDVQHQELVAKKIALSKPGLIILDPLYLCVTGDLKDGDVASSLASWMRQIAVQNNCPVLALHHTHKERYGNDGKLTKERDRSYGSRWLKSSATLWIQMSALDDRDGIELEVLKDRYKHSRKRFELDYDPSTRCVNGKGGGRTYLVDRIIYYLNSCKVGSELSFNQIGAFVDCAPNYIYELCKDERLKGRLERVAKPDRTVVWRVTSHNHGQK